MICALAVYENGVLRPKEPVALAEGQTVEVMASEPKSVGPPISDDEYARRVAAARSIHEWVELTRLLPPDDGGYDIVQAFEDNRRWSQGRSPSPRKGPTP